MPRSLTIPMSSGSDPDTAIDDASKAYGEADEFDYPIELCDDSPNGQCEFSALNNHTVCIHCGKESGL